MSLLDKRVIAVTGKGGVGKTTVAAALAVEAARRGKRVVLAETQGATAVPRLFGRHPGGYEMSHLRDELYTLSIDSESAIEDYVVQQIKVRALYKLVFKNRVMAPFMRAIPGLHDLIQFGKVWDLERMRAGERPEWDLVVVDAPATGHALAMLNSPQSMMDLTVAGPFHENAGLIRDLVEDAERTALVLVALPEEMPVSETVELYRRLERFQPQVALCVLNKVLPPPFAPLSRWGAAREALRGGRRLREAVAFTDRAVGRELRTQEARRRLREALPCRHTELPQLLTEAVGYPELASLGRALGERV